MSNFILQFLAGAFAVNAVPHLAQGLCGRPFRTPFTRLTGTKVSGPVVNAAWGWANAAFAYWLAAPSIMALPFGLGTWIAAIGTAVIFSRDQN